MLSFISSSRRRIGVLAVSLFAAFALTGCFRVEQFIDLSEETSAKLATELWVGKEYVGSEMDLFLDNLSQTIPAMRERTRFTKSEVSDTAQTWVVYRWEAMDAILIADMPFKLEKTSDGTYSFSYLIGPYEQFSNQSESDSILLRVRVTLPADIDFANTMNVTGPTAQWELRKADLARGVALRAITKTPPSPDEKN